MAIDTPVRDHRVSPNSPIAAQKRLTGTEPTGLRRPPARVRRGAETGVGTGPGARPNGPIAMAVVATASTDAGGGPSDEARTRGCWPASVEASPLPRASTSP